MAALNNIVAATDLSAPARHAAERAALVATGVNARLALVHVTGRAPLEQLRQLLAAGEGGIEQALLDGLRGTLQVLGEAIHRRYGVAPAVAVTDGDLLPSLLAHADALSADLLVLGARGSSFLRHILLGSTAERLLGAARCPVLVVKQPPHEPYRHLLVPVDFSPIALRSLQLAAMLAPTAKLTVMHAFDVPFEGQLRYAGVDDAKIGHYRALAAERARAGLDRLVAASGLAPERIRQLVVPGDVSQRILEQEQESDCDLIVVGKHGEGMFEELLLGSTTKHLLAESQCDVLVCR
ncbi:universal stress protein [Dechloromonas sp. XY25]|uniref:Universal stress protein n=1 Tax=Dechloromonas hankyongensis TaxID=2908002 RepID=A0ABS9K0K1_9RHOO|nr:universal stress protein [Dechloromonas hankyongensis]MCG2576668.1 universal stress protein [Dechloromonas hankyongensis]